MGLNSLKNISPLQIPLQLVAVELLLVPIIYCDRELPLSTIINYKYCFIAYRS